MDAETADEAGGFGTSFRALSRLQCVPSPSVSRTMRMPLTLHFGRRVFDLLATITSKVGPPSYANGTLARNARKPNSTNVLGVAATELCFKMVTGGAERRFPKSWQSW